VNVMSDEEFEDLDRFIYMRDAQTQWLKDSKRKVLLGRKELEREKKKNEQFKKVIVMLQKAKEEDEAEWMTEIRRLFNEIDIINEEKDIYLKGYLGMTAGITPPFLRLRTWWRMFKRKIKNAFNKGTRRTR